ncbi:hypothetical protein [Nocardioides sp.]|uniref:hypothetical protein n=1 Tax=Nocardioides sp. TaxID=35761 RepID=UPI00271E83B0|nr:hypothetical protein [Nocardioides sp.]MDO9454703.1 hypothetical protein [Nocardioides sp.]
MSHQSPYPTQPTPPATDTVQPTERVGLGLLAALGAVVGGVALTVVIWRLGYVAAISSLVIAFGAAYLYEKAAGRSPRKGLVPLLVLIVVGVAIAFFAIVASDAWDVYDTLGITDPSRLTFVRMALTEPDVLKEYGKDLALFGVFAVLGIIGVGRRLFAAR